MPINKNHLFEELDGIKCAIVETGITQPRVDFLKPLLELNGYTVVVVPSPLPKTPAKPAEPGENSEKNLYPPTFTLGVTDVMFNPTNAIFGRFLKTAEGRVVTLNYWLQKETTSRDDVPYFTKQTG